MQIVERLFNGDRRAVARLISWAEDRSPNIKKAMTALYPLTGDAHVIGVTGPPGAGKSTLVNELTKRYRKKGATVGIIAVDPTSPFTGGALLGDRIRMNEVGTDPGVFIRSMGTRGALGGLAQATGDAVKILDAFGKDIIIVETVGAGQNEVEIANQAHTTIVVEVPGMGDDIQANKAGIFEIADIFAVNKADRDGVDKIVLELNAMLDLAADTLDWRPHIVTTTARSGAGIDALDEAIDAHRNYLHESGQFERELKKRVEREFCTILKENLLHYIIEHAIDQGRFDALVDAILKRKLDPYTAADSLTEPFYDYIEEK